MAAGAGLAARGVQAPRGVEVARGGDVARGGEEARGGEAARAMVHLLLLSGMLWNDKVWYGMVWYGMVTKGLFGMVWLHDVWYTIPLYHQKLFLGEDARTGMRPNLAVYEVGLLLGEPGRGRLHAPNSPCRYRIQTDLACLND